MNHNEELQRVFENSIRRAIEKQQVTYSANSLTDLFIQPNPESAEFVVMNDEHAVLNQITVNAWADSEELNVEAELEITETILKTLVSQLAQEGLFDKLNLQKPFSVVLVDDEMETSSELLLIDDERVNLDENLLKQVDQELNDFFKKLMSNL